MELDEIFPHLKRSVGDFLFDEEGNIPRSKILAIGSMMIVMSLMLFQNAFAAHRSHSSHSTHSSHRSHVSHRNIGHTSHYTHSSHSSHTTHGTHNTHSTHSNTHSTHSTHSDHGSHSTHSTHSNAAPKSADLAVTPPPALDTVTAVTAEETVISRGTVMPVISGDTVESVSESIELEMNVPPATPKANG